MKNISQASLIILIEIIIFTFIVYELPKIWQISPLLATLILITYFFFLLMPVIQNKQGTWSNITIRRYIVKLNGQVASRKFILLRYAIIFILYGIPILLHNIPLLIVIYTMSFFYALVTKTYLFEDLISRTRLGRVKDEVKI